MPASAAEPQMRRVLEARRVDDEHRVDVLQREQVVEVLEGRAAPGRSPASPARPPPRGSPSTGRRPPSVSTLCCLGQARDDAVRAASRDGRRQCGRARSCRSRRGSARTNARWRGSRWRPRPPRRPVRETRGGSVPVCHPWGTSRAKLTPARAARSGTVEWPSMAILDLPGGTALREFRLEKLNATLAGLGLRVVATQHWHFVEVAHAASPAEQATLARLLTYGPDLPPPPQVRGRMLLVTPRLGTISPWSSKATDIARQCGLSSLVKRIERGTAYHLEGDGELAAALPQLHDRMTETVLGFSGGGGRAVPPRRAEAARRGRRARRAGAPRSRTRTPPWASPSRRTRSTTCSRYFAGHRSQSRPMSS